jgi:hypothetical protein
MTICGNDEPINTVRLCDVINSTKIPIGSGINVVERDVLRKYHNTFANLGDCNIRNVLESTTYQGFKQGYLNQERKSNFRNSVDSRVGYAAGVLARD